ncbi:MAG: hypothetical protein OIN66_17520 [Candidatus Methanoperedens sp.]|nr:hypothetical protein [Candidatus Methanoperedens sp.]
MGILNLTQRPRRCHNTVISEAEHFFIFRLQLETDIARIKEILPRKYANMVSTLPIAFTQITGNQSSSLRRFGYDNLYICVCIHRLSWRQRQYRYEKMYTTSL